MFKIIFISLLCVLPLFCMVAQPIIVADTALQVKAIGSLCYFLEDKQSTLNITTIQQAQIFDKFQLYTKSVPNFSSTSSAIWLKFKIHNSQNTHLYLEIGRSYIDSINLYVQDKQGNIKIKKTGDNFNFSQREILVSNFLFDLPISSDTLTYYLRVKCNQPLLFPLEIGNIQHFMADHHKLDYQQGIWFGFMLLIAFYNLFIYLTTKDKIYFIYVCYVLSLTVFMSFVTGYFFEYFWANKAWLNNYAIASTSLTIIFAVFFTQIFLNTAQRTPKIHKISWIFIVTSLLAMILLLFKLWIPALMLAQASLFIMGIFFLIIGILAYRDNYTPAKFYLLAWNFLIIGIIIEILQDADVLEIDLNLAPIQIGSAFEVLFLSFALADKINTYKKEKEKAQQATLEATQENEKIIREQNAVLEQNVYSRTLQLKEANEELNQINEELSSNLEVIQNQNKQIRKYNDEVKASIMYASRIQTALLPFEERMHEYFGENFFVLYKPRDVVSGDFYWCENVNGSVIMAVADCTGHGVPGAFMSMLGSMGLNSIIFQENNFEANTILNALHHYIFQALRQDKSDSRDGMDIVIVVINPTIKTVEYSGAMNPLYYLQKDEFMQIKADGKPIGGGQYGTDRNYSKHYIDTSLPTTLYLSTDGYQDQFGGKDKRKFMTGNFKKILHKIHREPLSKQKMMLDSTIDAWMHEGNESQIDDILIIGVQI